jgi:ubiquinone/menaquinone biosynthesis C-methylase UbiE
MTIDCSFNWPEVRRIAGPCIRPGGPVLTERALEVCGLPPGSRVADIGCGGGGTLEHLERTGVYRPVGLDYSELLLGEAVPRLGSGRLVRGRAETLPFKKGSFDALFCECVLSILGSRTTALREFARVLKEGGFLIVSDVFAQGGPGQGRLEGNAQCLPGKGLLAKDDLLGLLTGLGFSLLLWEEHERLLKEFVARMILAGVGLPYAWACRQAQERKKTGRAGISYFLLVALKAGGGFHPVANKGDGKSWTT